MVFILTGIAFLVGLALGFFFTKTKMKVTFLEETHHLKSQLESAQLRLELEAQNHAEKNESFQKQLQTLNAQFENLAQKIFEEKSQKFTEMNQKNITAVLDPIKERLKEFQTKIETSHAQEQVERGFLRGEVTKLIELNKTMSLEAHNLTKALKGENKTQGNWGELILENILERSGLRKGEEYISQGAGMGLTNDDGSKIQPDIIVNLPDGKHIIVDSKMTLVAYEQFSSAETSEEQEKYAKIHVDSLKRHIDQLSEKKYHSSDKLITPDFVLLFMPLEPAFALAFRHKPEIFQYAWDRNIAVVSPTTLLATLRTVSTLWKQDRRVKNALEIAERGGRLYEKFAGLLKDLQNLGDKLESAQLAHRDTIKKLSEGKGNLMDQVEELKSLGAKTEKHLTKLTPPEPNT